MSQRERKGRFIVRNDYWQLEDFAAEIFTISSYLFVLYDIVWRVKENDNREIYLLPENDGYNRGH